VRTRLIMEKGPSGEPIRYEGEYLDIDIGAGIRAPQAGSQRVRSTAAAMREGHVDRDGRGSARNGLIGHRLWPRALARRGHDPELRDWLERSGRQV